MFKNVHAKKKKMIHLYVDSNVNDADLMLKKPLLLL